VGVLETEAGQFAGVKGELDSKVTALEAEAAQSGEARRELEGKIASLESEVSELEAEVSGLENERNQLQAKIAALESQGRGLGAVGAAAAVGAVASAGRLFDDEDEDILPATPAEATGAETIETAAVVAATAEPASSDATGDAVTVVLPPSEADLTGNVEATDFAEMAKFKYPLEYVEGIGPAFAEKLKAIGLVTCLDFLKAGATRKGREELVEKAGISSKLVLKWVNHIDLYRVKGIGSEYADLLEASGVDTVMELAQRNPANLFTKMNEVNAAKELVRKLPTAAQVENWVGQAKGLPRVVSY
jgi:predicted flap endonuclease-1-like 5' DNA nuclease